ncbi:MAG: enolase C-terminal domain-like protein, partial [Casimicrobium sp.]
MNALLQQPPIADTALTIRSVNVRSVVVPLARPVVTANGAVSSAPLVLVDLETNSGVTGRAYSFAYSPAFLPALASLTSALAKSIVNSPLAPQTIEAHLRNRFTLLGGATNLAAFAISAIDMAAWDAFAKHLKLPLATVLGGSPKPTKAYAGNGVGVVDAKDIPASVDSVLADGVSAIKLRLGRTDAALDIQAVENAKSALAARGKSTMPVMVDFNQSLSVPEAVSRCRALDAFNLTWIEEPTRCDDWNGNAQIAAATNTQIQLGENIASAHALQSALSSRATDFVMLDLQQLGGVTGWTRAASVAQTFGAPISSHLFQEFSAHMLSVTPG